MATSGFSTSIGGDVPIEGDRELLQIVQDAQITAVSQFERGSLVAEIHDEWLTSLHSHSVIKAVWERDSLYWEAEYHLETPKNIAAWDWYNPRFAPKDGEKEIVNSKVIWIETPRMSCSYFPGRSASVRFSPPRGQDHSIFKFHPKQVWLSYRLNADTPLGQLLDPEQGGVPLRFTVRAVDNDLVVVERHHEDSELMRTEVSLAKGGRVIGYEHTPSNSDRDSRATETARFDWERQPSGTWVVREMEQTRRYPTKGDAIFGRYRMKLLEYDPDPEIPKDRFEVSSLKFAPGTRVAEIRGVPPNAESRTYRVGDNSVLPKELLDRLAEELSKEGFAKPKDRE